MDESSSFVSAYNFAASMFEGNSGARQNSLANLETELYILGVKYRTPHGRTIDEIVDLFIFDSHLHLDTYAVTDDVLSRFWFTYRTGFAPIGKSIDRLLMVDENPFV